MWERKYEIKLHPRGGNEYMDLCTVVEDLKDNPGTVEKWIATPSHFSWDIVGLIHQIK